MTWKKGDRFEYFDGATQFARQWVGQTGVVVEDETEDTPVIIMFDNEKGHNCRASAANLRPIGLKEGDRFEYFKGDARSYEKQWVGLKGRVVDTTTRIAQVKVMFDSIPPGGSGAIELWVFRANIRPTTEPRPLQVGDHCEYYNGDPNYFNRDWEGRTGVLEVSQPSGCWDIRWDTPHRYPYPTGTNVSPKNLKRIENEVPTTSLPIGTKVVYNNDGWDPNNKSYGVNRAKLHGKTGEVVWDRAWLETHFAYQVRFPEVGIYWVREHNLDLAPTEGIPPIPEVPGLSATDRKVVAAFLRGDDWRGNRTPNSLPGDEADRIAQILDPRSKLKREIADALEKDEDLRCNAPNLTADVVTEVMMKTIQAFEPSLEMVQPWGAAEVRASATTIAALLNYLEG